MMNYTKAKNAIVALMCYRDSLQDGYNGPDSVEVAEMAVPIIEDIEEELFSDCQECASRGAKIPMMARKLLFAIHYVANEMCKGVPGGYIPDPFGKFIVRIQNGMFDIYPDVYCEIDKDIKAGKGISYELGGFEWSIEELKNIVLQREGQNGGHSEPLRGKGDKSNIFDVEGRKNALNGAKEKALPDCIPGWFPKDAYFAKVDDKTILDGNRWLDTLEKLTLWLYDILRKGDFGQWDCISGVFQYRGKMGEWKPATADDLNGAFKNLNRKSKKK